MRPGQRSVGTFSERSVENRGAFAALSQFSLLSTWYSIIYRKMMRNFSPYCFLAGLQYYGMYCTMVAAAGISSLLQIIISGARVKPGFEEHGSLLKWRGGGIRTMAKTRINLSSQCLLRIDGSRHSATLRICVQVIGDGSRDEQLSSQTRL
ncbi:hypothetical protein BJ170DRAFT_34132 [Xylariales sp. AK1849]|nr:hypothetical protein BJ170DRAFT_34132 [Xylariales sp. AK1849]